MSFQNRMKINFRLLILELWVKDFNWAMAIWLSFMIRSF